MAPLLVHHPVHRLDALDRHFAPQVITAIGEDLRQDARIEEEGRANIKGIAIGLDGTGAAADTGLTLNQGNVVPAALEDHGRCKAAGPGADDYDTRSGGGHVFLFLQQFKSDARSGCAPRARPPCPWKLDRSLYRLAAILEPLSAYDVLPLVNNPQRFWFPAAQVGQAGFSFQAKKASALMNSSGYSGFSRFHCTASQRSTATCRSYR